MSFEVIIDQVRSFASRNQVEIRPLTLLVGENSSGKSTFLACIAAAHGLRSGFSLPEFNTPPYNMGTFETIATFKGGRYGRAKEFTIGFSVGTTNELNGNSTPGKNRRLETLATYENQKGNPKLNLLRLESSRCSVLLEYGLRDVRIVFTAKEASGIKGRVASTQPRKLLRPDVHPRLLIHELLFLTGTNKEFSKHVSGRQDVQELFRHEFARELDWAFSSPFRTCSSFAPIRSKPRRTYDTLHEGFDAEGDHAPTALSRLYRRHVGGDSASLGEALQEFGLMSGLFKDLGIKRLGKGKSDPFQILVNVGGRAANLADVGYGIGQVLPIIVQSLIQTHENNTMLIQQPEVHLHPRAQAALGTFFARLAGRDRLFAIETHSDYLVDRVRQEVAKGTIKSDDVQILFFDKPGLETTIHRLTIDENGNVENAPDEYRSFFMEESINLLTRTSG